MGAVLSIVQVSSGIAAVILFTYYRHLCGRPAVDTSDVADEDGEEEGRHLHQRGVVWKSSEGL